MSTATAYFHKNVQLLSNVVPTNDDFKKYFREGMFDKPNTWGFIHVSYYLFSIYNESYVKQKIQWPIICKQTEIKYRNDAKDFLTFISSENQDLAFPPVLASHLLLAGGTKFILIMWKLSQATLRKFLKRDAKYEILYSPKPGPTQNLAKNLLKNVTKNIQIETSKHRKEMEKRQKIAEDYKSEQLERQKILKAEISKLNDSMKELSSGAPVNEVVKHRLMDFEDSEIMALWKASINDGIKSLQEKLTDLNDSARLTEDVSAVTSSVTGESTKLKMSELPAVNTDSVSKFVPPDMQIYPHKMYNEGNLVLENFFVTFTLLLRRYNQRLEKTGFVEISECQQQLQASIQDTKMIVDILKDVRSRIDHFLAHELIKKPQKMSNTFIENIPDLDSVLFLPSPAIQIQSYEDEKIGLQNHLKMTPVEGAYKELFSRHHNESGVPRIPKSLAKRNLPIQRINFDDTLISDNGERQLGCRRFLSPKPTQMSFKNAGKYSRIFSTRKPAIDRKFNNSTILSLPGMKTSTFIMGNDRDCSVSEFSLNITAKSLLSSTIQFCTPEKRSVKHDVPANSFEEKPAPSTEPLVAVPKMVVTSVEVQKSSVTSSRRRRSITDLVERYKKILKVSEESQMLCQTEEIVEEVNLSS